MLPEDELQPQQLLALSTIDKALQDSGIVFEKGSRVAVLVGLGTDMELYRHRARVALRERLGIKPQDELTAEQSALLAYVSDSCTATSYTSNIGNIIATRISSIWGFTGPAFTVTQGANSVFRCLELASLKLASGEIDAAVVAGVDLSGSAEALFSKRLQSIFAGTANEGLANDSGVSFEETAASYFVGEGAGALVLKRFADVPRSSTGECEERVYACIDAVSEAATVQESVNSACNAAGISPFQVGYVEMSADGALSVDVDEVRGIAEGYGGAHSEGNSSAGLSGRSSSPPPPEQFGLLKNVVSAGMQLGSKVYNTIAQNRSSAKSSASAVPSAEDATRVVIDVLAAKTGYEPEMIEMDMNLETELGVDSIKRVEILSEVQKELNVEAQNVAALSRTQTVGEVVDVMIKELGGAMPAAPVAAAAAAPVPVASAPTGGVSADHATKVVIDVLAAKTGYEPEMIEMDMNLETELGVDSIKRVEILSEVQKELNVEAQNVAALSRTQTVGEVVDAMIKELGGAQPAAVRNPAVAPVSLPVPASSQGDSSVKDAINAASDVDLTFAATHEIPFPLRLELAYDKSRPVLLVDDGSTFTSELARALSSVPDCSVTVLTFSKTPVSVPSSVKQIHVTDRSEETIERVLSEVKSPCGFIYQHSDADNASEHAQLRWALLMAKHLSPCYDALRQTSSSAVRPFFVGIAHMGNGGRLGIANPDTAESMKFSCSVSEAQRGAIF
ncbi:MAG: hypothetical protein SGPRY_011634, partial [Prymnesium sp.]